MIARGANAAATTLRHRPLDADMANGLGAWPPNRSVNRTRRFIPSNGRASALRAGGLGRWAALVGQVK